MCTDTGITEDGMGCGVRNGVFARTRGELGAGVTKPDAPLPLYPFPL